MHKRALTSFLTLGGFLIAALSGIVLYTAPAGWAAKRSNWMFLGMDKYEWSDIHVVFGLLWLAAVVFHIYFNWKVLRAFIYQKAKGGLRLRKEMAIAGIVITAVFLMGLYRIPPVGYITRLSAEIKTRYAVQANREGNPGAWSNPIPVLNDNALHYSDQRSGRGPYGSGTFNPNAWGRRSTP